MIKCIFLISCSMLKCLVHTKKPSLCVFLINNPLCLQSVFYTLHYTCKTTTIACRQYLLHQISAQKSQCHKIKLVILIQMPLSQCIPLQNIRGNNLCLHSGIICSPGTSNRSALLSSHSHCKGGHNRIQINRKYWLLIRLIIHSQEFLFICLFATFKKLKTDIG